MGKHFDIAVMIQGDEPMVTPMMIEQALRPLIVDTNIKVTNLMSHLNINDSDKNEVKVVVDKDSNAMYFSRFDIPYNCKKLLKQVCIIGFKIDVLKLFSSINETPCERFESVDMNRLLENGIKIKMVYTEHVTYSVDTPSDLKYVEYRMKK